MPMKTIVKAITGEFMYYGDTTTSKFIKLCDEGNTIVNELAPLPMRNYKWIGSEWVLKDQ